jgi:hypothetical protein
MAHGDTQLTYRGPVWWQYQHAVLFADWLTAAPRMVHCSSPSLPAIPLSLDLVVDVSVPTNNYFTLALFPLLFISPSIPFLFP